MNLYAQIVSAVPGASELVQDLIVSGRSMLVLGPGAAAVLRDAAAGAALSQTVCVVDTRGFSSKEKDIGHLTKWQASWEVLV